MKTILVTGIAGFVMSHVSECLIRNGHRVIGIDNLSGGMESNVPQGAHFIHMDICDELAIKRLFDHIAFDAVIHGAAFASENLSNNCPMHTYKSIVMGSATLINAAVNHDVELFVEMSSIAIYGSQPPPFSEESTAMVAHDPYGAAKICAEFGLVAAERNFGINSVIFRPHNLIGIRQNIADSTRNVASIFIRQALSAKPLTIYGSGEQTRAWSPVSQVAKIIAATVDRPTTWRSTYNIGGDRVMKVFDLANIVCKLCGVEPDFEFLVERKEAMHAHSIHGRVARVFPDLMDGQESIESCLTDMIAEARKNPLPPIQSLPRIEIQKNLNPAWTYQP